MTRRVDVSLRERSYPIYIGEGLLPAVGKLIGARPGTTAAIVTNTVVGELYSSAVHKELERSGFTVVSITIPDGEIHKTVETWSSIHDRLLAAKLDRKSLVVALGGGVVGDLAGFAAATYQRGIDMIQIPTTLLSQVDSSVGGKTGVNHPRGKNLIGAFYQPRLVVIDTSTLATLPDRELRAGLAEVIKYGLIRDRAFFDWLESNITALVNKDPAALAHAIEVSCRHKAEIVANDETEQGERALLNLGHTFGHAIEAGVGYGEWLHGEAVAAGTVLAARLSARMGWLDPNDVNRIVDLFVKAGLPTRAPALGVDRYLELMSRDKKVVAGSLRLILLNAIGKGVITDEANTEQLRATLA
jgi:3-dehydroquinate synthase